MSISILKLSLNSHVHQVRFLLVPDHCIIIIRTIVLNKLITSCQKISLVIIFLRMVINLLSIRQKYIKMTIY